MYFPLSLTELTKIPCFFPYFTSTLSLPSHFLHFLPSVTFLPPALFLPSSFPHFPIFSSFLPFFSPYFTSPGFIFPGASFPHVFFSSHPALVFIPSPAPYPSLISCLILPSRSAWQSPSLHSYPLTFFISLKPHFPKSLPLLLFHRLSPSVPHYPFLPSSLFINIPPSFGLFTHILSFEYLFLPLWVFYSSAFSFPNHLSVTHFLSLLDLYH